MEISIVGLGYVGTVSAACLAAAGNTVWGVDINTEKVRAINEGRAPIIEPNLSDLIAQGCKTGRLHASCDLREALANSELTFIAVATPSRANGDIDASHLVRACTQIAQALASIGRTQIVVIRSSVLPTIFDRCREAFDAEAPGRVRLCVNPEFLREGSAIEDFQRPPFTLLGVDDNEVEETLRMLYQQIPSPILVLPPKEALLVKYASNAFHALKTAFANEIGVLCREMNIDGKNVMSVFCKDTKLNISPRYLIPGFAFGGSCLPKDVRALSYAAKLCDVDLPLIGSLLPSNERVIQRAFNEVSRRNVRRIGLIGLAFKSNTDDLRESPFVELAERLLGKGYQLKIYDPNVSLANVIGSNKEYIEKMIPHLSSLLVSSVADLSDCQLLVVGHRYAGAEDFLGAVEIPSIHL
jgi:GDP-mannose 6-dehydrogenase